MGEKSGRVSKSKQKTVNRHTQVRVTSKGLDLSSVLAWWATWLGREQDRRHDPDKELVLPLGPRPAIFDMFPVVIVAFVLKPNPFFTKATIENLSPTNLILLINKSSNIAREQDGTEGIWALRVKPLRNGLEKDMT
jgi:hypothetical protein